MPGALDSAVPGAVDSAVPGAVDSAVPGAVDEELTMGDANNPRSETAAGVTTLRQVPGGGWASLQELMAAYDADMQDSLRRALQAPDGTEKVRVLHSTLRRSVAVHDATLQWTLCPLLDGMSGGAPLVGRLRHGCLERADLLERFEVVTRGVGAANVYPVAGEEIEEILAGLQTSLHRTLSDEAAVPGVLRGGDRHVDPDAVVADMNRRARQTPSRLHAALVRHPDGLRRQLYRLRDRFEDWSDAHHGWSDGERPPCSPRALQVAKLTGDAVEPPPTLRDILAGFDATVEQIIGELRTAAGPEAEAEATRRLSEAIALHDAVLGGVLCPLLQQAPGGARAAERLRRQCLVRVERQEALQRLSSDVGTANLYRLRRADTEAAASALVDSFRSHEKDDALGILDVLQTLPDSAYRTSRSWLHDALWPWHSEGPSMLAMQMAQWARTSPSRSHRRLLRHPSSRLLRSSYHLAGWWRDLPSDTAFGRWLFPRAATRRLPPVPAAAVPTPPPAPPAGPAAPAPPVVGA